jgi:hypothetical protein
LVYTLCPRRLAFQEKGNNRVDLGVDTKLPRPSLPDFRQNNDDRAA